MRVNHFIACNKLCAASKHCITLSWNVSLGNANVLCKTAINRPRLNSVGPHCDLSENAENADVRFSGKTGALLLKSKSKCRLNSSAKQKRQTKHSLTKGMCWAKADVFPGLRDRSTSWTGITVTFLPHSLPHSHLLFFFSLTQFSQSASFHSEKNPYHIKERKKLSERPVWLCSQPVNDRLSWIISVQKP